MLTSSQLLVHATPTVWHLMALLGLSAGTLRHEVGAGLAAGCAMLLAWLLSNHRCPASSETSFAVGVVAQVSLHLLSACLSAAKKQSVAGWVAIINWGIKLCCTIQCALCWGGPPSWQTMFSNSAFYTTAACSACLDFYQMQQGQHLRPYIMASMTTLQVTVVTTCVERAKFKQGAPTHGWFTTWALLMFGMVLGPRLADAILHWLVLRHRSPATLAVSTASAVAANTLRSAAGTAGRQADGRTQSDGEVSMGSSWGADDDCCAKVDKPADKQAEASIELTTGKQHAAESPDPIAISRDTAPGRQHRGHAWLHGAALVPDAGRGTALAGTIYTSSLEAVQRVKHQHYHSTLGLRKKVTVKVSTSLQLHQLPAVTATQLQASLAKQEGGPRFQLLDVAARPGCILLSLDLLQDTDNNSDSNAASEQQALMVAQSLLPCLVGLIQPANKGSAQQRAAEHAPVMFSIGNVMLVASQGPDSSSWTIQVAAASEDSTAAQYIKEDGQCNQEAEIMLHVKQVQFLSMLPDDQQYASRSDAAAAAAAAAAVRPASSTCLVYTACLHVSMLQSTAGRRAAAAGGCPTPSGWSPEDASTHEGADTAGRLRVLARCKGSYLTTTIASASEEAADASLMTAPLQVEVQVPDMLLPRHHAEGPPVGLLPVVLELWQGVRCVSSTPVLLHTTPAVTSAWPADLVWWWGTSGRAAQLAAEQLQALNAGLQQAEGATEALLAWHAFLADLHTWLAHIRKVCTSLPGCCLSKSPSTRVVAGTQLLDPPLGPTALLHLGQNLAAYAHAVGLLHVQHMLAQQQAAIQTWSTQKLMPRQHGSTARSMKQHVRASIFGYSCPACEARCRASMSQQLAVVQTYSSMVLSGLGISSLARYASQPDFDPIWTPSIVVTTTLWITGVVGMYRQSASHQPGSARMQPAAAASRAAKSCGPLSLVLYASRVIPTLLYATGLRPVNHAFMMLVKTRTILVHSLVLAYGEQLQVAVQLPYPGVLLLLGMAEVVNTMVIATRLGLATPSLLLGLLLCNICASVLMDMRMRALIVRGWSRADAARSLLGTGKQGSDQATGPH